MYNASLLHFRSCTPTAIEREKVGNEMEDFQSKETNTEVVVEVIPLCDLCFSSRTPAVYDGKTKSGPWAYMCEPHFHQCGVGLGVGKGQRLVLRGSEGLSDVSQVTL